MAETLKRLGATTVLADTDTTLYTVPASTTSVVSSICICNRGNTNATFRIAHVDGAIGAVANEDYLYYDVTVSRTDTFIATIGVTMGDGHTLLVRASNTNVNFIAWGTEVT